jgi:hypothetical protein
MAQTEELVPCVVEGRQYAQGDGGPVVRVAGIGLVHDAGVPHTILGDAVDPVVLHEPNTIDATRSDPR